jgi:hypothetical protein
MQFSLFNKVLENRYEKANYKQALRRIQDVKYTPKYITITGNNRSDECIKIRPSEEKNNK